MEPWNIGIWMPGMLSGDYSGAQNLGTSTGISPYLKSQLQLEKEIAEAIQAGHATRRYVMQSTQLKDIDTDQGRLRMIGMRLRLDNGEKFPFEYLDTHVSGEKVFVFIVQNGTHAVLEDELQMFPSDTLVTQLRLIAQ